MSDDHIDIHVEPGGEGLVKWAKQKLRSLRQLREDLNLPSMTKTYDVRPGERVWINTTEQGDRIRIFADSGLFIAAVAFHQPGGG